MQAQVKRAFIRFVPAFIAFSVYLIQSLGRRANARNVSLLTLYGGQFTFSTQLLTLNCLFTREPPRKRKRSQDFPRSTPIGCFPALGSVWTRVSCVFSRLDTGKLLVLTLCRSNYLKTFCDISFRLATKFAEADIAKSLLHLICNDIGQVC